MHAVKNHFFLTLFSFSKGNSAADPRWKVIKAVKEKRVYTCPEGSLSLGTRKQLDIPFRYVACTNSPSRQIS